MKFFEHALLAFMIHDMGDMVAHVKRTCRITRENLRPDMFEMVKENIVACAGEREVIQDITCQSLNRVSKFSGEASFFRVTFISPMPLIG